MEKSKKEGMNRILSKLEDVQNSQVALVEKLATIQVELLELPNNELEQVVVEAHSSATKNIERIKGALEKYQVAISSLE